MRKVHFTVAAALAILSGSTVFGFAEFARGEAILTTTASTYYDSRILGGVFAADDYIFTLDPRLIYRREAGRIKLDGEAGVRINRYYDFHQFDSEDFVGSLTLRLPAEGSTLPSGEFETTYNEHTDVSYDVNRRVQEKRLISRVDANVPLSLKTSLLLGAYYNKELRNLYADRELWEFTAGFRYQNFLRGSTFDFRYRRRDLTSTGASPSNVPLDQTNDLFTATFTRPIYEEIRASATYGYRILDRSAAEVVDEKDRHTTGSFFSVNVEGPFLPKSLFPKLESSLSFGYQRNDTPGLYDSSSSRFVGNMRISWHARERTQLFVNARRTLDLSVDNLSVETTILGIGVHETIGNFTTATVTGGYERRDYRSIVGRIDDVLLAQATVGYRISKAWSTSAEYRYRDTNSNNLFADYTRYTVSAEVTYTY